MQPKVNSGFTLVELLVVIAIAGILVGLASPSFKSMIERWQVERATKEIIASISLARSEAVRRGSVVMSPASSGGGCTASTNGWECGWQIATNGTPSTVLNVVEAQKGVIATASTGSLNYTNTGNIGATVSYSFVVRPMVDGNDCSRGQRITVNPGGRIQTEKLTGNCT